MLDLEKLKESEAVKVGVKSKDFQGNVMLNEYVISKTDTGYTISYEKIGERYQKIKSVLEVDVIDTYIYLDGREMKLKNFIDENCTIEAITKEDKFRIRLKNVIYYHVMEMVK